MGLLAKELMSTTIKIMLSEVFTVKPDSTIKNAYLTMKENDIRHLSVVDVIVVENSKGKLLGILTSTDMLALLIELLREDPQEISKSAQWTRWTLGSYLDQTKSLS